LLFCYHYDPMTGKYGLVISKVIRTLGSATVIGLVALIFLLVRHDRNRTSSAGRAS
jgi:protein SCO1